MTPTRIHELLEAWAQRAPEAPFLIEPKRTTGMAQLQAMVEQGADELRMLGVRAGDRVLIVAENCVGHVALILACSRVRHAPLFAIAALLALADFIGSTRWARSLVKSGSDLYVPPTGPPQHHACARRGAGRAAR